MSVTLGDLITTTRHLLSGLDADLDTSAALTAPIDGTATTLPLDTVGEFRPGVAEVGLEEVRIKAVDLSASTLLLYPFGRGYNGSPAATHPAGSEVRFAPTWPAYALARTVNSILTAIYPQLYAVRSTTVPLSGSEALTLPEAVGVISVYRESLLHPDQWFPETRWVFDPDSTAVGKPLRVGGGDRYGRVRVVYATRPGLFDLAGSLDQSFATVTGLPERASELIAQGVTARLTLHTDTANLRNVAAAQVAAGRNPTVGMSAARLSLAEFQQRVESEAAALVREHPIRVHKVR